MKKYIALFLVITFMGMNCATHDKGEGINLEPGQKPGAKVIIQKKNRQQVKGELIAVKENSLLLKEHESGADESVDVSDINKIKIVRKSWGWKGVLLIGGGLGLIAGISQAGEEVHGFVPSLIDGFIWGAIIAAIVGAVAGADKTIQVEGKSDSEIQEILEDLRKKARVPNFQ